MPSRERLQRRRRASTTLRRSVSARDVRQHVDGFRTRTPFQYDTSLRADYAFRLGAAQRRIVLTADVFNLFNTQRITDYNNYTQTSFGSVNPDFGQPYSAVLGTPAFQAPRQIRLGARVEF